MTDFVKHSCTNCRPSNVRAYLKFRVSPCFTHESIHSGVHVEIARYALTSERRRMKEQQITLLFALLGKPYSSPRTYCKPCIS